MNADVVAAVHAVLGELQSQSKRTRCLPGGNGAQSKMARGAKNWSGIWDSRLPGKAVKT